jgi:1-phosphofructokinase family hexose kinase
MILCVTPNPAVDRTLVVPRIHVGEVMRAQESMIAAGGKGLNVARVARALGGEIICAGFLGGHSGRLVAELAEREGLGGAWTWIAGETRTCVIVIEPGGHDATVFNETGPTTTPEDWRRLIAEVPQRAANSAAVCVSGSLPPGSGPRDYAGLLAALRPAERPVWVDTSGPALGAALEVPGVAIKVNGSEAAGLVGSPIERPDQAAAAARALAGRTGGPVVLTLGGAGAVLADAAGTWHAQPPALRIVSTVGSGDAFLAGLVLSLTRGAPLPEALRRAAAAGAANALLVGGGRIDAAQADEIWSRTELRMLNSE